MKINIITLFRYGAIAGNILFILWVSFNAVKEGFSGTVYEKISYVALMGLLITNSFFLIAGAKNQTVNN